MAVQHLTVVSCVAVATLSFLWRSLGVFLPQQRDKEFYAGILVMFISLLYNSPSIYNMAEDMLKGDDYNNLEIARLLHIYPQAKVVKRVREINKDEFDKTMQIIKGQEIERGVACILLTETNMIVLVKRSSRKWGGNKWALPGGTVDLNEDFHVAIAREVKEECGVDIKIGRLMCIDDEMKVYLGKKIEHITCLFVAHIVDNKHPIQTREDEDKGISVGVFQLDEVPPDMALDNNKVIKDYTNIANTRN